MQTAQTRTISGVGTLSGITGRTAAKQHGSKKTHYGSFRSRNAFLKTALKPIPPQQMTAGYGYERNCITRTDYEYLRDSYFNYARLLHIEPKHDPGQSYGEGIANLYAEMDTLIGDDLDVNIEPTSDGELRFAIWKYNKWGKYNLYWFPLKFIQRLRPEFRRLMITFLHDFMIGHNLSVISDLDEADWIFDWIGEENDKAILSMIDSYKSGSISKLFQRVKERRYHKNLPQAIAKIEPQDDVEKTFLELMKDGLPFVGKDTPSIMNYEYDPEYEQEPDFTPIRLEQQIGMIYDPTDLFTENMIEYLNNEMQQTYEVTPCTVLYLKPDTQTLFESDNYPERLFAWMDRIITFIRDTYE